jgi:hypothetical protein
VLVGLDAMSNPDGYNDSHARLRLAHMVWSGQLRAAPRARRSVMVVAERAGWKRL